MRRHLDQVSEQLPEGMEVAVLFDQSVFIAKAVGEVRNNALLGGLLAVLVLYVFLRELRSTLIIGVAIPISIVATFILMYGRGVSLNVMSLGGLALGVGMLVDNSIVVLEAIHRKREDDPGCAPAVAAARGAAEVSGGGRRFDPDHRRGVRAHRLRGGGRRGPDLPRPGADGDLLAADLARSSR